MENLHPIIIEALAPYVVPVAEDENLGDDES